MSFAYLLVGHICLLFQFLKVYVHVNTTPAYLK